MAGPRQLKSTPIWAIDLKCQRRSGRWATPSRHLQSTCRPAPFILHRRRRAEATGPYTMTGVAVIIAQTTADIAGLRRTQSEFPATAQIDVAKTPPLASPNLHLTPPSGYRQRQP